MLFFVFTFVCGLILIVAPLLFSNWLSKRWLLPKTFFWRAGLFHLLVTFFYFAVADNLSSVWPAFDTIAPLWQAVVVAVIAGFFTELGRFVILDRVMKTVRSVKEGIYFGVGWAGLTIFFLGILAVLNSFGMYFLIHTQNLAAQFPEASKEQIQLMEEIKTQAVTYSQGNPLVAFTPLIENASNLLVDVAITLLILFGLLRSETRFVWLAVFARVLMSVLIFYSQSIHLLWAELVFVLFGVGGFFLIKKMRKLLP